MLGGEKTNLDCGTYCWGVTGCMKSVSAAIVETVGRLEEPA